MIVVITFVVNCFDSIGWYPFGSCSNPRNKFKCIIDLLFLLFKT